MKVFIAILVLSVIPVQLLGQTVRDPWAGPPSLESESRWAQYTETRAEMIDFIWEQMVKNKIMGLSIALVDDQEVVWARGFGYANLEEGTWATESTVYRIGSISKTFTATTIMNLQDQGLLNIDKPLSDYLPEFSLQTALRPGPLPSGPITLQTMLTHHSGIPGDLVNNFWSHQDDPDSYIQWILKDILPFEYATAPVDFVWAYSNTAVVLLGEVVARVSGRTFGDYTDRLFETMGMDHSSFFLDKPFIQQNLARGYDGGEEYEYFYCNGPGAGSAHSNVLDMAKYIAMIHAAGWSAGGRVLKPETLDYMLTCQNVDVPLDFDYRIGLGWFLFDSELDYYAGRLCFHDGATHVFRSHLEILLDHKLGVVVLSNSAAAWEVVPDVARETLKLALEEKTGLGPPPPPTPPYSPVAHWSQQSLEALAGVYVTALGYDLVEAVTGGLEWTLNAGVIGLNGRPSPRDTFRVSFRGNSYRLVPRENGWFSQSESQAFEIELNEVSGRSVMAVHQGEMSYLFSEQYDPVVSLPRSWYNRFGSYRAADLNHQDYSWYVSPAMAYLNTSMKMKEERGMLIIELAGGAEKLVVEPLTDTLGVIRGLGRNRGAAVRVIEVGGEEQIRFLGKSYRRDRDMGASGDYDGDGTSDLAVFRPETGLCAVKGLTRLYFGVAGDVPVSGDYDGDGTTDIAIFRRSPAPSLWAIRGVSRIYFGDPWDSPVPSDYDGDGECDIAVFDESSGRWDIRNLTRFYFGVSNDYPVPGDYDGDGSADIAVFRAATGLWAARGVSRWYFGTSLDLPIPADYDGDGTGKAGIFRPSSGLWAVRGMTRRYYGGSAMNQFPPIMTVMAPLE